uniref:Lipocalin n=1 Tax=Rhipicephalus appendiculatus TaxID=34631 RepID=A0A131Z5X6_RHIAP
MATIREVSAVSLFIFSILITLQVSGAEDDDQDSEDYKIDIREFLNTSETIWTLNTTSKTPQMCKKETTYNITTNETFFRRTYQGSSEEFLQGTFLYNTFSSEYDAMDVGKPGKLVDKEEIVFQGYNNTCAVFKITLRANEINDDKSASEYQISEDYYDYFRYPPMNLTKFLLHITKGKSRMIYG